MYGMHRHSKEVSVRKGTLGDVWLDRLILKEYTNDVTRGFIFLQHSSSIIYIYT